MVGDGVRGREPKVRDSVDGSSEMKRTRLLPEMWEVERRLIQG